MGILLDDKYALLEYTMRAVFRKSLYAELPEGAPFSPENLACLIRVVAENLAQVQGHCPAPRGQMDTLKDFAQQVLPLILASLRPRAVPAAPEALASSRARKR